MDDKLISKIFGDQDLYLRPATIKSLKDRLGDHLSTSILDRLAMQAKELNPPQGILDADHIRQIIELLMGTKINKGDQGLQKILDKMRSLLIIIDPFEDVRNPESSVAHKFKIACTAKDKQNMAIRRLRHIESILDLDPQYSFTCDDPDKIYLSSIGVAKTTTQIVRVLGILIQIDRDYYLTDGSVNLKLKKPTLDSQNGCIVQQWRKKGLVNVGSVIIAVGKWETYYDAFEVYLLSQPQFHIRQKLQEIQQKPDLNFQLKHDTFGVLHKIRNNLQILFVERGLKMETQKALELFAFPKKKFSIWFLSNFCLDNPQTVNKTDFILQKASQANSVPSVIFFMGKFTESHLPQKDKLYGNDLVKVLSKFPDVLYFFMPSFNDFPLAYSMPHAPMDLSLLCDKPLEKMHAVSNPLKVSVQGIKIEVIRTDISREMRKNHILQEQSNHEWVCETLLGQQYLSTFESNQTALKWNYNHSMMLDPGVQFLIFADQTLQQFNYTTEINSTTVLNPGNFGEKGEFCALTGSKDGFRADLCQM